MHHTRKIQRVKCSSKGLPLEVLCRLLIRVAQSTGLFWGHCVGQANGWQDADVVARQWDVIQRQDGRPVIVWQPLPGVITCMFQSCYGIAPLCGLKHIQSYNMLYCSSTGISHGNETCFLYTSESNQLLRGTRYDVGVMKPLWTCMPQLRL